MPDIDWQLVVTHSYTIAIAYLLALPLGWNRETKKERAGLRTFPLVSVACCAFTLIAMDIFSDQNAQAKMIQGIVTGMGFIGGGAILKDGKEGSGIATAAALWATGAMGVAIAWHRFEIALLVSVITFLTLQFLSKAKPLLEQ